MLGEIAHGRGQELWLFDTFEGMPQADDIDYHRIGEFADCSAEAVQALVPRAKIFQGVFPETWTALSRPLEKHIAFVHVDCDQYKSISDCINVLGPLMVKGGIMWFDDYGYPHLPGAQRAVDEHLPDRQTSPSGRAYYIFP